MFGTDVKVCILLHTEIYYNIRHKTKRNYEAFIWILSNKKIYMLIIPHYLKYGHIASYFPVILSYFGNKDIILLQRMYKNFIIGINLSFFFVTFY